MTLLLEYLSSFLLTFIIEAVLLLHLTSGKARPRRALFSCLAANLATHPLVWFAFPLLGPFIGYPAQIAISEIFAFLAEAAIYTVLLRPIRLREAAAISFICNLASFAIGLAL